MYDYKEMNGKITIKIKIKSRLKVSFCGLSSSHSCLEISIVCFFLYFIINFFFKTTYHQMGMQFLKSYFYVIFLVLFLFWVDVNGR